VPASAGREGKSFGHSQLPALSYDRVLDDLLVGGSFLTLTEPTGPSRRTPAVTPPGLAILCVLPSSPQSGGEAHCEILLPATYPLYNPPTSFLYNPLSPKVTVVALSMGFHFVVFPAGQRLFVPLRKTPTTSSHLYAVLETSSLLCSLGR
jgi:hypothetical protein